ncbi:DUF2213 domain-containing protein [Novosphingobium sp. ST904]|uniref:DUF2213 domain-containing protein n=1 Tax=Novosphingobium sp. ST904 TaxID=1684385 RepID=UPI001E4E4D4C|nr:DUF2213 domain-containing protein [Novosphingobium sp. ST904]
MAVRARAARTGVYQYGGSEVDPDNKHGHRDTALVNVLRDDDTVFDEKSVRSFIGKPVTDDHPAAPVTTYNWRDHARGTIMGAMRDGDYLAFDLLLTDAEAIAKVDGGKRELSNGYSSDLEFGDFTAPDGTKCQARQKSITGNHVALVDRGRAGSECAIKDGFAVCDALPSNILDSLTQESPVPKIVLIDGLSVDVSNADTAAANIATLLAARDAANGKVAGLETQVATLTAESQTKDAKITTLEQQVKDAKPTPAQLRDAGKALIIVADKAKTLGITVTDEMDEAAIMSATVSKQMGDAAKDWTADQIAASFAVLTKDAKVEDNGVKPLGSPINLADGAAAWNDNLFQSAGVSMKKGA